MNTMAGTERLFLAMHLPDSLKQWMSERMEHIASLLPFQRWTVKEDLHLTLIFIGDTQPAEEEQLKEALSSFTKPTEQVFPKTANTAFPATSTRSPVDRWLRPFVISLSRSLGTFGRPSSPSVLWAGITPNQELIALQNALIEHLRQALPTSFVERISDLSVQARPYRPHITLARQYRGPIPLDALKLEEASRHFFNAESIVHADLLQWSVEAIDLYRSHLGRRPMYERLTSFPLSM
ncbi:MAG: 2'-5' RNA ligase family protein [Candidatus Carbobacillus sp.]|nr:2'-5' RNA ligase family protein [Candidatus Carbobacillus sp.]